MTYEEILARIDEKGKIEALVELKAMYKPVIYKTVLLKHCANFMMSNNPMLAVKSIQAIADNPNMELCAIPEDMDFVYQLIYFPRVNVIFTGDITFMATRDVNSFVVPEGKYKGQRLPESIAFDEEESIIVKSFDDLYNKDYGDYNYPEIFARPQHVFYVELESIEDIYPFREEYEMTYDHIISICDEMGWEVHCQ